MRLVYATSRVDDAAAREIDARRRRGERVVLLMLHQDVFVAPWYLRGLEVCGLASTGDAGDIIDAIMRSLGHRNVRGGSSESVARRRTLGALRDLIREGRARAAEGGFVIAITPDGSQGPAGACKPGFGLVALETGASIWCIDIHSSPSLLLRTWDRTMIPLPFGRTWARLDGPIEIPSGADAQVLEDVRQRAEGILHRLHAQAAGGRTGETLATWEASRD
jgi:lysophospholipid acyltransferase (LPLAT)-like uncharacterized protein